ncbi:MAG TPA: MFS transporter [Dehalococcoidia bacterium]|nr:MFS transporter [Dehalococcoidia bacterium]
MSATRAAATGEQDDLARPRIAGVSRNVFLLGLVSFFADVSSEMVYPIVPLFLRNTLGAPVLAVGLIEGVAESTASLGKFVFGWFSDRLRRRLPFTAGGYALAAVAKPMLAAATVWPFVLFARFVDRSGKGVRTAPRDALIAASTTPETRGRAFGLHRSMDTSGAILGPLIALAVISFAGSSAYRPIFVAAVVPGVISVAILLFVREVARAPRTGPLPPLLSLHGYDRRFLLFLLVTLVFAAGNSSDAFLVLRAKNLGLGAAEVVLAYVLYNVTYAALSFPAGGQSDRLGRKPLLIAGFAVFALVYAGFAAARSGAVVWLLFAVYGAYIAFTDGVGKAFVSDLVPDARRGTAMGLYNATTGAMLLVASLLGGLLWDEVGPAATFTLGAGTAAGAALLMLVVVPSHGERVIARVDP